MNIRKIRKAVLDAGFTWEKGKRNTHVIVRDKNGRQVAVMSASASDWRSGPNFVAQLRQAGIRIPRKGEQW